MGKFDRLFNARGIAIIGASEDPSRSGSQPIAALKSTGFQGGIYPVNPRYQSISGFKCYASPADIKEPVDVAVIALPAAGAVEMVKTCGEIGIPYAVVLGSGFREVGPEGLARQNQMVTNAHAHGMRIIGPNCNGIANIHSRMYAAFGSISRPPLLQPGPVSMVMQSGGFGYGLALSCRNAGIGFRMLIASGNEADLTAPELIDALIDDDKTEVILAYLEGVVDGRALMAAGERALAAGKPILVWKAGKTRQGIRVAATHTANMTGSYDVWRAAFRQCGIIDVTEMEEVTDYIRALRGKRFPKGRNVVVLSPSGGSAVVFSDAADKYGLNLPTPKGETMERLVAAVPKAHSHDNPIDLGGGGISGANKANFQVAVDALLADPDIHQLCMMTPTSLGDRAVAGADVMIEAVRRSDKPIFVFSTLLHDIIGDTLDRYDRAAIPVLLSPVRVARAAGMLATYAEARNALLARQAAAGTASVSVPGNAAVISGDAAGALDEARSKAILSAVGIRVTRDVIVPADAGEKIDRLGLSFPLAVKILSPDIAHKTDIGGVVLNVADEPALRSAIGTVVGNARRAHPSARIDGVLVSEMIADAVEVIVGVVNDSVFGPVVMLGMGGVLAEAVRDVSYRVAPFALDEAHAMIGELRARSIFDGLRGRPACDVAALAQALVTIARLAFDQKELISELDINPLMVRRRGQGVVAADALVMLKTALA